MTIYDKKKYDYVSNTINPTFPDGLDVEVFSFSVLEKMWINAKLPSEREHVTQFILNNNKFKIGNIKHKNNLSHLRWTLDQKEDLEFLKKIISNIETRPILMNYVLKVLNQKPELIDINSGIDPDQGIKKSKEEDKKFLKGNTS